MEKQILDIHDLSYASQKYLYGNIHRLTRGTQGPSSFPYTLWHHQQFQVIVLFIVYLIGSILSVANSATASLGSSLFLNGSTTLHWNETLVSDDGQFVVGFYCNEMTPSNVSYNLAIWYAKVPIVTPVWMPATSVVVSNNATLSLCKEGVLQLEDIISGVSTFVWASSPNLMNVTMATILNTGNLVLLNNTRDVVWQSFDYPTNTLLPNQRYLLSNKIPMRSWKDEGNYTEGQYLLTWRNSTRIELLSKSQYFKDLPYWNYDLSLNTYFEKKSISIEIIDVFLTSKGEFLATSTPNIYSIIGKSSINKLKSLRRISLDFDGNLRMYSWQLGVSKNWNKDWEAISNTCKIYGICGPYAVCVDGKCQCPKGFKFKDMTDKKLGCIRLNSPSFCKKTNRADEFIVLPGDYPYGYDFFYFPNMTVEYCQQKCLSACECQCATTSLPDVNGIVQCWLKRDVLINGVIFNNRTTYIKMASSSNGSGKLSYSALRLMVFIIGPLMVIHGMISCIFGWSLIVRWIKIYQLNALRRKWKVSQGTMVRFTYNEIKLITQNFIEQIGKGDNGIVYKGEITCDDAKVVVAVKQLDILDQDIKDFINEVDVLGSIHHNHLIHLHGYCADAHHKVLVYEYMENGSLDIALFQVNKSIPILEWRPRFNIAIQIAKGLAYLHNDCHGQCIIHCHVKPTNILIDSSYSSKVADIRLPCILNQERSHTMTRHICDSCESYLAPEWTSNHIPITSKIDVYSFGMVLFEIIRGRQNSKSSSLSFNKFDTESCYFPLWAYLKLNESGFDILQVLDPSLTGIVEYEEVERVLKVAFWCINNNHELRPSMSEVVQMLEGHIPIELPVPQPNLTSNPTTQLQ